MGDGIGFLVTSLKMLQSCTKMLTFITVFIISILSSVALWSFLAPVEPNTWALTDCFAGENDDTPKYKCVCKFEG